MDDDNAADHETFGIIESPTFDGINGTVWPMNDDDIKEAFDEHTIKNYAVSVTSASEEEMDDFVIAIEKIMKGMFEEEINHLQKIATSASIDGHMIYAQCGTNNRKKLESFLSKHFSFKPEAISIIAEYIIQNITSIQTYSIEEMSGFIAYFEINHTLKILIDNEWNEEKFKKSTKKQFISDLSKSRILTIGTAAKIHNQMEKAMNADFPSQNAARRSQRVPYEEKDEEEEEEKSLLAGLGSPELKPKPRSVRFLEKHVSKHISMSPVPPENHGIDNFDDWKIDRTESRFPTYIAKALYYLSEDDTLELLIDRAIAKVLSFSNLWMNEEFVDNLYNDITFKNSLEKVYDFVHNEEEGYDFLDDFIGTECKRQIAMYQKKINDQTANNNQRRDSMDDAYFNDDEAELDENMKKLENHLALNAMSIQSYISDSANSKNEHIVVIEEKGDESHEKYEWALFRRKRLKKVFLQNVRTNGYWKILTRDAAMDDFDLFEMEEQKEKEVGGLDILTTDINAPSNDFPEVMDRDLSDLNAILLFLQRMRLDPLFNENEEQKTEFIESDLSQMEEPIIRIVIRHQESEQNSDHEQFLVEDEYDNDEETTPMTPNGQSPDTNTSVGTYAVSRWYDIYWWNQPKDADGAHSLAMKTYASKGKMEYYLRYVMPSTNSMEQIGGLKKLLTGRSVLSDKGKEEKEDLLEWVWYDNDLSFYRSYDLGINVLKQLEACFHSNCNDLFPKALNCRFNNLLLTEMKTKRKKQGKTVGLGYVLRFSYSNTTKRQNIINIEQLSLWKNAPYFSRNVQRRMNGKNSLFLYFSSNHGEYVNEWKCKYLLQTEEQQKYFWSHILAVASATHYISVEMQNQVLTFDGAEDANVKGTGNDSIFAEIDDPEMQKVQKSYMQNAGFLVAPQFAGGDQGDDLIQDSGSMSTAAFKFLFHEAQSVVLQKFNAKHDDDFDNEDLPKQYCPHRSKWKWRNGQQQFYCDECASLLQFAEFVRKFVLEYEHPETTKFLWPWYRNTFHHNDFIKYHNYISRYGLNTLFVQNDILQQKDTAERDRIYGCCIKIKKCSKRCEYKCRTRDCCRQKRQEEEEKSKERSREEV